MLQNLAVMRGWPLWTRLAVAGIALTLACLFQIPLETEMPDEPFLLFFLIVIASTVAFGEGVGFFGVGLSAFLSFLFFEPFGSLALQHAADLIRIEVYALITSGSVLGFSRLGRALIVAHEAAQHFEESDGYKSLLLRELVHRVANNFATVAALIRAKANLVGDAEAKSVLNEAIEQVSVMARVHRRLHVGDKDVALDSESFVRELCADLKASMARGRPVSIECVAIRRPLLLAHAIPLGLIVTELVTNTLKHAFPDCRRGTVRVRLEGSNGGLRLTVEDNGTGFESHGRANGRGQGQTLLRALSQQLGGCLEFKSTDRGSTFRLDFPHSEAADSPAPARLRIATPLMPT